jgi:hypothetical protein
VKRVVLLGSLICGQVLAEETSPSQPPLSGSYDFSEVTIELEHTPCFGDCPTWQVKILGDGTVIYRGLAHVESIGLFRGRIEPDEVVFLVGEFLRVQFVVALDKYAETEGARLQGGRLQLVRGAVTDAASTILKLRLGKQEKRVVLYENFPVELRTLAELVEIKSGVRRWLKKPE